MGVWLRKHEDGRALPGRGRGPAKKKKVKKMRKKSEREAPRVAHFFPFFSFRFLLLYSFISRSFRSPILAFYFSVSVLAHVISLASTVRERERERERENGREARE